MQAQLQKSGDSYRTLKTHQTVYVHPSSSLFQHQPPVKCTLYYELVMTSKSYMRWVECPGSYAIDGSSITLRQIMEIKPSWLMEGQFPSLMHIVISFLITTHFIVAPHYFKEADLEQLATGEKKMPKAIGASSTAVPQA
jgi:pre-mRNA-splicing factor ATP-dependent RNA helicase DHX16